MVETKRIAWVGVACIGLIACPFLYAKYVPLEPTRNFPACQVVDNQCQLWVCTRTFPSGRTGVIRPQCLNQSCDNPANRCRTRTILGPNGIRHYSCSCGVGEEPNCSLSLTFDPRNGAITNESCDRDSCRELFSQPCLPGPIGGIPPPDVDCPPGWEARGCECLGGT